MDGNFTEIELTIEQQEELSRKFGVMINDEIDNLDTIFSAYSPSEYVRAVAEDVKISSIKTRMLEFVKNNNIALLAGFAILRRRSITGSMLGYTHLATKFTIAGLNVNEVTIEHTVCSMDIPKDQYKMARVVEIPDNGVYSYVKLESILEYKEVTKEEQATDENVENSPEVAEEEHTVVSPEVTD